MVNMPYTAYMGSCTIKTDSLTPNMTVCKRDFQLHHIIGKGGFGKVWKLEHKRSGAHYAMKEMSKARVLSKKSVVSVMNERELLTVLRHSFIVNMHFAFQDRENLYLVTDFMPGGDLRFHLSRLHTFTQEQSRFLVACILTGLGYIHSQNVIHRDIKPENLVLDSRGYVRITDFGIARVYYPDNARESSGTPGYMAPEVICQQPHSFAVDYFAVGVLLYEFMTGKRPYPGRTRKEIKEQVISRQATVANEHLPEGWDQSVLDLINRLLQRKPINRLGNNGLLEVKTHPWFSGFAWSELEGKNLQAPFVPDGDRNFSSRLGKTHNLWKDARSDTMVANISLLQNRATQQLFAEYEFDSAICPSPC